MKGTAWLLLASFDLLPQRPRFMGPGFSTPEAYRCPLPCFSFPDRAAPEACPVRAQAISLLEDSPALPTHTLAKVTRQNLVTAGCEWQGL